MEEVETHAGSESLTVQTAMPRWRATFWAAQPQGGGVGGIHPLPEVEPFKTRQGA